MPHPALLETLTAGECLISPSMLWALSTVLPSSFIPPSRTMGDHKTLAFASHLPLVRWRQFVFFRILSYLYVGSMFLTRCLHLTQSCTSSPDSYLSHKSFPMLSNHLRFGIPLLLFPEPPSPSLSCPYIFLLFSIHALTISTYFQFLGYFSHLF